MGAITLGKGSRNRVRDLHTYRSNFDDIDWGKRGTPAATSEVKLAGKRRFVYADAKPAVTPGTQVVLSDGTTKAVEDLAAGTEVLLSDGTTAKLLAIEGALFGVRE